MDRGRCLPPPAFPAFRISPCSTTSTCPRGCSGDSATGFSCREPWWTGRAAPSPSGPWRAFDGFKEEIYLADFRPDPSIRDRLGVSPHKVMAVIRPPARTAHYHDARSEAILDAVTARLSREPEVMRGVAEARSGRPGAQRARGFQMSSFPRRLSMALRCWRPPIS